MQEISLFNPFEKEHAILATLPIFQPKYTNFFQSSLEGRNVKYLQTSPLAHFKEKITNLGAHFHGFGKRLVKGANLAFRSLVSGQMIELDFKINHVFRSTIQQKIDELRSMDRLVLNALLDRSESVGKNIQIKQDVPFPIGTTTLGMAIKVTLEGLGTLFICSSPEYPSIYNRVVVQTGADKNIGDFHALLAFLGLEHTLHVSTPEDQERHKIGHLFRTFYPREAFSIERSAAFFSLTIDELKDKIIAKVPEMANIFASYLDHLTLEEILPGRMRYRIPGLAKQSHDLGARALTSALTGAQGSALYERTASILKLGMLSSETRKFLGIEAEGLSALADFSSGGSDIVYTQMITASNCDTNADFRFLTYASDVRLIFSLDVIETGTYQYLSDAYGNRACTNSEPFWPQYTARPGILEFVDALQKSTVESCHKSHEILVKERIAPQYIQKILVPNNTVRNELIRYLEERDLIQNNTILGHPLDEFILVEHKASEKLFM